MSVDGIAICYGMDSPGFKLRWQRDFPHQSWLSPTHKSLLYMGNRVPFPEVKRPGVALTIHSHLAQGSSMGKAVCLFPVCACLAFNATAFNI